MACVLCTDLGTYALSSINSWSLVCRNSSSIIALSGQGQFIGEVLLFDNTGRDSPMGSWQTCVRARTQVQALILTVKDLKDLVARKPAAEVELRAGPLWFCIALVLHITAGWVCLSFSSSEWCMHTHAYTCMHCLCVQVSRIGGPLTQPGVLLVAAVVWGSRALLASLGSAGMLSSLVIWCKRPS